MRSAVLLSAIAGLAAAAPRPQDFDFAAIAAALPDATVLGPAVTATAESVTLLPSSAISAAAAAAATAAADDTDAVVVGVVKRETPCQALPAGSGPSITPDTPSDFQSSPLLQSTGSAPAPYTQAFTNLQGSTQQAGYLGLYTLTTYDPSLCAAKCNKNANCQAFNIYYERDPTMSPADACPNPVSTTNIKCTLYGYPVSAQTATNKGQYRNQFQVVISGSAGYNKVFTAPTVPGFAAPVLLSSNGGSGNAAINAPPKPGGGGFDIGSYAVQTGKYDPSACAVNCLQQTKYDHDTRDSTTGEYRPCNYFNAYVLLKNGVPQGTVCSKYDSPQDPQYAVNTGFGDYTISDSYGYTLNPQDPGVDTTPKN